MNEGLLLYWDLPQTNPWQLEGYNIYRKPLWGSEFENSSVSVENTVETLPSYGINFGGFQPRISDGSPAEEEVITSHTYKVG